VLDFFGSSVVYPSSGALPGNRLGKVAGLLSYAEAVRSSVGGGPRVQTATMVWCETKKIFSLDQEQKPFRQAVDCFALERSFSGPLGKDLADDCYAMENSSSGPLGKDLLACSKTRVAVNDVRSLDRCGKGCRKTCSEGDHEWDCDVSGKEVGFFKKILDSVGDWLDRVCRCPMHLGRISFGSKLKLGFLGLGWLVRRLGKFRRFGVWSSYARMRTGSRRLRCLPFTKKTKQCRLAKSKPRLPPNFTQKLLTEKTFALSNLAISTASSTVATSTEDCAGHGGDFHPVSFEAVAPGAGYEVGSPVGRVLPFSPLKEPTSKPLIQYKRKGRKPKSAVGQWELKDVGFLRRGFLKSSSSSLPPTDRGFSGGGCSRRASSLNSTGGSKAIKTVAFLSALDEEHRRWDKIERCEL
jgi:hypothetical protein